MLRPGDRPCMGRALTLTAPADRWTPGWIEMKVLDNSHPIPLQEQRSNVSRTGVSGFGLAWNLLKPFGCHARPTRPVQAGAVLAAADKEKHRPAGRIPPVA